MVLEIILIVTGCILMAAATLFAFKPWFPASLTAFAGLVAFFFVPWVEVDAMDLLFWGVATVIVLGLDYLLPRAISHGPIGRGYICGGALVGMFVGVIFNTMAAVIIASAVGAFFGAMALSRTPDGEGLRFPSKGFVNFLAARGLPAVVTFSMVGLVIFQVVKSYAAY